MADTADMVEDTVVVMDIRVAAATVVVTVAAMAVIHIFNNKLRQKLRFILNLWFKHFFNY